MVCRCRKTRWSNPSKQVKSGEVEIVPKTWEKTFFNWMENIQPWCVSRQLWWGHRIPAWFDQNGNVFVAQDEAAAQAQAGDAALLTRDEDVLDTWFSSALWPFATLGWPEQTDLVQKHYPNDLLISGFDILFFWDARMMMMGNYNHRQGALAAAVPARAGPRRRRLQNVQVQGQCRRSAGPDRPIWRGCAALLHGVDGKPGPRHQDG